MRPSNALLAAGLLLAATAAHAERADREKEIVIVADRSAGDDVNKLLTLQGNVVVTQGTMRITAEKVTVKEDAQKNKVYVATGSPVTFRQKREKLNEFIDGEAQRAEFDDKAELLKLYNRARVNSGANQLTGEFISYDMQRELAEVAGAPPGVTPPRDSRVKVIILPPKKAAEDDKASKPAPALSLKPEGSVR